MPDVKIQMIKGRGRASEIEVGDGERFFSWLRLFDIGASTFDLFPEVEEIVAAAG